MGDNTKIQWSDATWNPIVGCSIVSPGCTNCYAMSQAERIVRMAKGVGRESHYAGTTELAKGKAVWTGKLALAPEHILTAPLRWTRPRKIFVNSMGDLFHEDTPDEWIDRVFAVMALTPQHTFQILTKRSARMLAYFDDLRGRSKQIGAALGNMLDGDWIWNEGKPFRQKVEMMISLSHGMAPDDLLFSREEFLPLPNVWLGVSAERQKEADERIPDLLATPAAIRFVSCEPLLGPIDLTNHCNGHYFFDTLRGTRWHDDPDHARPSEKYSPGLDQVIVGGESGKGARPMHPDWARDLRDQCQSAGVAYFFKQWGEYLPVGQTLPGYGKVHGATTVRSPQMKLHCGGTHREAPKHAFAEHGVDAASLADDRLTFRVGKRRSGRRLDGREWNELPETRAK